MSDLNEMKTLLARAQLAANAAAQAALLVSTGAVRFDTTQTINDAQMLQARTNIGLGLDAAPTMTGLTLTGLATFGAVAAGNDGELRQATVLDIPGRGQSNGIATLDANSKLAATQLPEITQGDVSGLKTTDTPSFVTIQLNAPTADPHVAGQIWNNAGVATFSAG